MPRYADGSKERVREAVDMVDLVGTRTDVQRAGPGRFTARCPFHEDRTASCSIDADAKLFHCFGCQAGGDCFSFVMETESLAFPEALEWLARRYNVTLEVADEDPRAAERRRRRERLSELLERASRFYVRHLWESPEAEPARRYLAGRGLEEQSLREFRVGYAPRNGRLVETALNLGFSRQELLDAGLARQGSLRDFFWERITFTLADARGRVIGFGARQMPGADPQYGKYVNSPESDVFHKGDHLYAADLARRPAAQAGETVLVEGYTDVIAMHQAGMRNVVASMGTALTERQVAELVKLAPRVLLAQDADAAGQKAILRAAEVAADRALELRVVALPAGRDPADILLADGPEALRGAVAASVPFVRFRVERELEAGDVTTAEGKDAVVAALRPVFATLAPSALREELVGQVADRLDLAPALVASWLPVPGGAPGARRAAAPPPSAPRPAAAQAGNPVVRAEWALLLECVKNPPEGEPVLAGLDDDAWSSDATRRTAAHLRGRLADPGAGLPDDDAQLRRWVAGLAARAQEIPQVVPGAVRLQDVELRIMRLDRAIEEALRARAGGIAALRQEREALVVQLHAGLQDVHAATRSED